MYRLGLLTLLAVWIGSACAPTAPQTGGQAQPAQEERDSNQTLRVAATGLVANMTPQASSANHYQYWPLYDNLTQYGPNFEVRPSVAERWELSPDGLTWTFFLRGDVRFSNGDPLTANDVAFTLNEIIARNWPQRGLFGTTIEATALDDRRVAIRTRQQDITVPFGGQFLW
ncbi:MAG: ABC transporter substrate-binding protein, partial [Dehalococcoidia bacterium]|nr:ABC transporter substrate-binding protein [Dehalococcoidia bacterium]